MGEEAFQEMQEYGRRHVEVCIELYNQQLRNGLYFLHEHPWGAKSWDHWGMQKLMSTPGVWKVRGDMCQFDMTQRDVVGEKLLKKPTGYMTNAPCIAEELNKTCTTD